MVRYSTLPFRELVRRYDCDIAFTHMMMADCFTKAKGARDADFQFCASDKPLIAQFAATDPFYFAKAAELIAPYVDGVDLNCGCPQRWAIKEGIGACMCTKPEQIKSIVKECRQVHPKMCISVKIRIVDDIKSTVQLARSIEHAGASFLSVHGRTISERNVKPHYEYIKAIKESISIPVVANGGVYNPDDLIVCQEETGADGVMCAQGLLNNPALFAGHHTTPIQCVQDWINLAITHGTPFITFHHHLVFMLEACLPKSERKILNNLPCTAAVLAWCERVLGVSYQKDALL